MQKRGRTAGILGTIIIHLLIVLPFILHFAVIIPPPPPTEEVKRVEVTLLPQKPLPRVIIEKVELSNNEPSAKLVPMDAKICTGKDKQYLGVGFIWNVATGVITHIPEFYPAYKAGLRLGDMVLNPDRELVNGYLDFDVLRSHEQLHFHVKAEHICFTTD